MLHLIVTLLCASLPGAEFQSHRPTRPLPAPSQRPFASGPSFFVDSYRGDDSHSGGKTAPWKTIGHAVKQLRGGDTLYLRGGLYYESVKIRAAGTPKKPITIRSYPGELAVIDGGWGEFTSRPEQAWELTNAKTNEYRRSAIGPLAGGLAKDHRCSPRTKQSCD